MPTIQSDNSEDNLSPSSASSSASDKLRSGIIELVSNVVLTVKDKLVSLKSRERRKQRRQKDANDDMEEGLRSPPTRNEIRVSFADRNLTESGRLKLEDRGRQEAADGRNLSRSIEREVIEDIRINRWGNKGIRRRRRYSEPLFKRSQHDIRRSLIPPEPESSRHRRSSSHRDIPQSQQDHTSIKVTLPFSEQVLYAGAVGIIAGAATAVRLRSSDADWIGDKGLRAGSTTATAAMASLAASGGSDADFVRDAALPIIASLGVDHILWE